MAKRKSNTMFPNYTKWVSRQPAYRRWDHLYSRYKIRPDDYYALMKKQKGVCAVCKEQFTARPVLDHAHDSNVVRGLVHQRCNIGVAYIEDPAFVKRAQEYLGTVTVKNHDS